MWDVLSGNYFNCDAFRIIAFDIVVQHKYGEQTIIYAETPVASDSLRMFASILPSIFFFPNKLRLRRLDKVGKNRIEIGVEDGETFAQDSGRYGSRYVLMAGKLRE